jgi:hypothetical protein
MFVALVLGSIAMIQSSRSAAASDDDPRATALHTAIIGVGEACDQVIRVFHQGNGPAGDFWNAGCRDGHTYSIRQDSKGNAQVLSCAMLKVVSRVECFKSFDRQ